MSKLKALGKTALFLGLIGGPIYAGYRYFRANPLYEDIAGRYNCKLVETQCTIKAQIPRTSNVSITYGEPYTVKIGKQKYDANYSWFDLNSYYYQVQRRAYMRITPDETEERSITMNYQNSSNKLAYEYQCKIEQPKTRGVFIRPCVGQFYESFGGNDKEAVVFGGEKYKSGNWKGRTLQEACEDLRDSGITDIFIAFKVDHEDKGCGFAGNRLYLGDHDEYLDDITDENGNVTGVVNEKKSFQKAHENGFDPVGAIIEACATAYNNNFKYVRIHAWVPIFKDRIAARIEGQKGYLQIVPGIGGWIDPWLKGDEPDCTSDVFAEPTNEKVVEGQMEILDDIVSKYGNRLYGISLDYVRYNGGGEECKKEMQGNDKGDTVSKWIVADPDAVANFVKKVNEKYNYKISINVMPWAPYRESLGQDSALEEADIIMPMLYSRFGATPDSTAVGIVAEDTKRDHPDKEVIADLKAWPKETPIWEFWAESDPTKRLFSELATEITLVSGIDGYALFTYDSLLRDTNSKSLASIKKEIGME